MLHHNSVITDQNYIRIVSIIVDNYLRRRLTLVSQTFEKTQVLWLSVVQRCDRDDTVVARIYSSRHALLHRLVVAEREINIIMTNY